MPPAPRLHVPWLSPFLASHQHESRWWMMPLQPLTFLWVRYQALSACFQHAIGVSRCSSAATA